MNTQRKSDIQALRPAQPVDPWQLIATLQGTLQQVIETQRQLDAQVRPPVKAGPEAEQDAAVLAAVAGGSAWLPDVAKASGLTKQVANTAARRLAYRGLIWYSLEAGPSGKLTSRLRARDRVVTED